MYERERQLGNTVRIFVGISHEVHSDCVGWQLHFLDKVSGHALVLCREQGQSFVGSTKPLKGVGSVSGKRMFHVQRAQGVVLVWRAVAEVEVQRYFFCDSAAHRFCSLVLM